jgi:DNA repair protein RadC
VAQAAVSYAEFLPCPECGHGIPLAVEGLTWSVRTPRDVADRLVAKLGRLEREELWVLSLNAKNLVLDASPIYRGNVSAALVRVGELFAEPIRRHAAGMILVHNHPSGDPTPSPDDLHLTAETVAAGRLLDVDVLDHIVLGNGQWVSMRDRGVRFDRVIKAADR